VKFCFIEHKVADLVHFLGFGTIWGSRFAPKVWIPFRILILLSIVTNSFKFLWDVAKVALKASKWKTKISCHFISRIKKLIFLRFRNGIRNFVETLTASQSYSHQRRRKPDLSTVDTWNRHGAFLFSETVTVFSTGKKNDHLDVFFFAEYFWRNNPFF